MRCYDTNARTVTRLLCRARVRSRHHKGNVGGRRRLCVYLYIYTHTYARELFPLMPRLSLSPIFTHDCRALLPRFPAGAQGWTKCAVCTVILSYFYGRSSEFIRARAREQLTRCFQPRQVNLIDLAGCKVRLRRIIFATLLQDGA